MITTREVAEDAVLPSPTEIEHCLQDAADRQRAEIARLQAERADAAHEDRAAHELTRLIVQATRRLESLEGDVLRTVLILDTRTAQQEAFAVVSHGGGRCVSAGGCDVQLVSRETPAGRGMLGCNAGDSLPLGRVVSIDSRPTRKAAASRDCVQAQEQQAALHRQAKREEKQCREEAREEAKCREQEAFDRRAAAHFQRREEAANSAEAPAPNPPKTTRAGRKLDDDRQLKWPF